MKAQRFDDYIKNGSHFHGLLVVVRYLEDVQKDPRWGTFGAELTYEYLDKAKQLVKDRGYNVVEELLHIPDYVVRIK